MALRRNVVLILLVALSATVAAQDACDDTLVNLFPCLSFVEGESEVPSQECCTALGTVIKDAPVCLCRLIGYGTPPDEGAETSLNVTLAKALPTKCGVEANEGKCPALVGGAPTPTASAPLPPAAAGPTPPPTAGNETRDDGSSATTEVAALGTVFASAVVALFALLS